MGFSGYKMGVDIGSTTVKLVILDPEEKTVYGQYRRHHAKIQETLAEMALEASEIIGDREVAPAICGSGGITLAKQLGVPFVQEVVAVAASLEKFSPGTDVAIELGGEDAKIIYFTGGVDQRMNGICAGGTGSFIDQMAALLQTDAQGLNEYAKNYQAIYPIAARCGVFAKSDIQPLINEGATREDLSASIFQAVVNQTISGLACGKPIRGNVAFLGGPLHFLSELRAAFIRTLKLTDEQIFAPDDSHLFAAIGAAMNSGEMTVTLGEIYSTLKTGVTLDFELKRLDPLFENEEEFKQFRARHDENAVLKGDLRQAKGPVYLGIDAGSTTTKMAVIDGDGRLLHSFYSSNNGSTLTTAVSAIKTIRELLPPGAYIARSCSTGYGEALLKAAFNLDEGEVETIAHYRAASFFEPEVDCILDIGGQDMKCIRIKDHAVDTILLNEACSSGCGSFIENFANSLGYTAAEFATEGLYAKNPIDLGTRCTVFMNSNVKQAQKEGATVQDISAGLAYSVIKNALFKVINLTDSKDLGERVVVQGGTFYNQSVLRAFEKIWGGQAICPDVSGIMGAFGAALLARDRCEEGQRSTMLSLEDIEKLTFTTSLRRCGACVNNCLLTVNRFSDGRGYTTGNRCERGLGAEKAGKDLPNLYKYKLDRVFDYEPLATENAPRGVIGLPRVLNMYENYPFWATFFKTLGFSTVLSPMTTRAMYELGMESIPSETECYPAKLAHGHVQWLINNGVKTIFYPAVISERAENENGAFHYNCPIVGTYPQNIEHNVEEIGRGEVRLVSPYMALINKEVAMRVLPDCMKQAFGIEKAEVKKALDAGWKAQDEYRAEVCREGERVIKWMEETGTPGIVLAGRPYHVDPEINHGIPEMLTSYGFAVLSEDSVAQLAPLDKPMRTIDQWMYHSRLYSAAEYVKLHDNMDLIQLNSFGCGIDAITIEQVREILTGSGKLYTVIKIDEMNNLGAARIRVRSLISAIRMRREKNEKRAINTEPYHRTRFTKAMKKQGYTILCPPVSPIHFKLLQHAFGYDGHHIELLDNDTRTAIETGLKYVNNDACYPCTIMIGQVMDAVLSGRYDTDKLAVFMFQTGGACRASNYLAFLRRALEKNGLGHVPVVSISMNRQEVNEGFKLTPMVIIKLIQAAIYGDVLMKCLYKTRPYEVESGSANAMYEKWNEVCIKAICRRGTGFKDFGKNIRAIVSDFDALPIDETVRKPKVGIVGEVYAKFMPIANNNLVELLESEGAEVVCPDLVDLLSCYLLNYEYKTRYLGGVWFSSYLGRIAINLIERVRRPAKKALDASRRFHGHCHIDELARYAEDFVSLGNHSGEGWLLSGEIAELIDSGVKNIICAQPFACLPNHVVGKGVMKNVRDEFSDANIVAIDYDSSASEVNQLNRIKLMLSVARKNMAAEAEKNENVTAAAEEKAAV
ncbi:MAG: 2-hydroxyacyl-CoA dehydratase [Oscillospiraceae bacterium]|nr:2-hydroxyacyl-CoA dehydratase [Oscillospiraceae bacterium]